MVMLPNPAMVRLDMEEESKEEVDVVVDFLPCGGNNNNAVVATTESKKVTQVKRTNSKNVTTTTTTTTTDSSSSVRVLGEDCDAVLDLQENFVSCVEGLELQHDYEQSAAPPVSLVDRLLPQSAIGPAMLTSQEAAMIRLQANLEHRNPPQISRQQAIMTSLRDLDVMNIFGMDSGDITTVEEHGRRRAQTTTPATTTTTTTTASTNNTAFCCSSSSSSSKKKKTVDQDLGMQAAGMVGSLCMITAVGNADGVCFSPQQYYEDEDCEKHASPPAPSSPSLKSHEPYYCAICDDANLLHKKGPPALTTLPCCEKDHPQSKVCAACMLFLTHPTEDGASRVGRCPRCCTWLSLKAMLHNEEEEGKEDGAPPSSPKSAAAATAAASPSSSPASNPRPIEPTRGGPMQLDISTIEASGKCNVCNQEKEVLVENEQICDACFLGRRQPLLYECRGCHGTQRIPHPMYRYQQTPSDFGTTKVWACQSPTCGNRFTQWRIAPQEKLSRVPAGDAPWDVHSAWRARAKDRVGQAQRDLAWTNNPEGAEGCVIL